MASLYCKVYISSPYRGNMESIPSTIHISPYSSSPKKTLTGNQASPQTLNRSGRLLSCFTSSSVKLQPWESLVHVDSIESGMFKITYRPIGSYPLFLMP